MLGFLRKKLDTPAEIAEEKARHLNEMIEKSSIMERLVKVNNTGWREFCVLLDDYIDKCKKRKAITALDRADDRTIYELKLLDHEIYILNWVKQIPDQFIKQVDNDVKAMREEEDAE